MGRSRYRYVTAAVLIAAVVAVVAAWGHTRGTSANGSGLTYEGSFYWASGAEVRADALGSEITRSIPFQDTTATLREIKGLDPKTTLAAWLPMISTQVPHPAWILISTDQGRGTNPQAFPDTAAVLNSR